MRIRTFLFTALLLLSASTAWAQNFRDLAGEELKKMIDQREKVLIVDARTQEEYMRGHIPQAVNIPPEQFSSIQSHLPAEKNFPIVFYCRGFS